MHRLASLAARPRFRSLLCAAFLCLLPFTLYLPVTFGDKTLLPADNLYQYEPFRNDAALFGLPTHNGQVLPQNELASDLILQNFQWKQHIRAALFDGELPLWNPNLFGGVPFLAAGQHSALYPFSVLYWVLPLAKAFGWFMVSQLALAGVAMFALVRSYGLRRASATFAGVAFQLSGLMVIGVVHPMIVASAAWLPLILLLTDKVIRQDAALGGRAASTPWAFLGALAIACHILAGHVEITVYTALVTTLYALWRIAGSGRLRDMRFVISRLAWLAGMGLAGALLASIQLLPMLELVTRNFRGAGRSTFEQVLSYAFPSRYVLLWLMPNIYGSWGHHNYLDLFDLTLKPVTAAQGTWWGYAAKEQVESSVYAGLSTVLFAAGGVALTLAGALRRRAPMHRAPAWFFIGLAVLCVLFIFGTPAYGLLYYGLPGVNQLHSPFRWKFPLTIALAVLAAIGFEQALYGAMRARLARVLPPLGVALGIGAIAAVIIARLAWPTLAERVTSAWTNSELARARFDSAEGFFSYLGGNVLIFGALLLSTSAVLALTLRRPARWQPLALIALLAFDLNIAWAGFAPAVDTRLLEHTPAAIAALQSDGDAVDGIKLWRVSSYEPNGQTHNKPANANMLWSFGLQDMRGYDSIIPKQYADYMKAIEPQGDLLYNRISPLRERASLESPLIDLLGVKYVLTENVIDTPGFETVGQYGALRIYRNTRVMPRAYTMPASSTLPPDVTLSVESWFGAAIRQFDPRNYVIVEDASACGSAGCAPATAATAQPALITAYSADEAWIDTQNSAGWLILNDSYFPGWRAWVRPQGGADASEVEVPVHLVNGNFRGVRLDQAGLPAGASVVTVRFKYSPDSVRYGAFASVITLVAITFAAGVYAWRSLAASTESLSGAGRVARNSAVLSGMNIVARLISFAFAIVVARLIGPNGVGAYYFAVVVIGWFEIVMNFGLNTYLTREVSRDRAHASAFFFHTTALRLMLAAAVAPVLALVLWLGQNSGYFSPQVTLAIAILGVSQVVSSFNTGLSALFYAFERGEIPAAISVISALATASIGAVFLLLGWGVPGLALTSVAVNLITLLLLLALARAQLGVRLSLRGDGFHVRTSRLDMLRDSTPLMLNHLLASIEFKLDVPILKANTPSALVYGGASSAVSSESVVGWYSTGYRYIDAFNIIPSFFTQSLFPALSRMASQGNDAFMRAFVLAIKLLVIVAFPLAVISTFLSGTLAGFFGPEFLPHGAVALSIMAWSMVAGWINSVTNYALIAVNQQRTITRAFLITLIFNLAANAVLIPLFSYQAAAVVTIGSEIIKGAVFYFYVRRHIGPLHWPGILARPALAGGVMALITALYAYANLLLPGLLIGAAAYIGVLVATRALDDGERAILAPLVRRGAR